MGEIVAATIDLDVEDETTAAGEQVPGLGWSLSDETLRTIEAIEANIRCNGILRRLPYRGCCYLPLCEDGEAMSDDRPLSEVFRIAARDWVDKEAAASLLETTKSSVLSQKMQALGEKAVNKAELTVKASEEWHDYLRKMVDARTAANLAKMKLEWIRMRFSETQSAEATARAERRM